MKVIWHVYIDKEYRLNLSMFSYTKEWHELPFSDQFFNMRLFATKNGAKKYVSKLVKTFRDWFAAQGVVELPVRKAADGGEFQNGVILFDQDSEKKKVVMNVWIKAVCRKLRA